MGLSRFCTRSPGQTYERDLGHRTYPLRQFNITLKDAFWSDVRPTKLERSLESGEENRRPSARPRNRIGGCPQSFLTGARAERVRDTLQSKMRCLP